jgi:hypothetical protein
MQTDGLRVFKITANILYRIDGLWKKYLPVEACLTVLNEAHDSYFSQFQIDPAKVKDAGYRQFQMLPATHQDPYFIQRVWLAAIEEVANTGNPRFRFSFETIEPYVSNKWGHSE